MESNKEELSSRFIVHLDDYVMEDFIDNASSTDADAGWNSEQGIGMSIVGLSSQPFLKHSSECPF